MLFEQCNRVITALQNFETKLHQAKTYAVPTFALLKTIDKDC